MERDLVSMTNLQVEKFWLLSRFRGSRGLGDKKQRSERCLLRCFSSLSFQYFGAVLSKAVLIEKHSR